MPKHPVGRSHRWRRRAVPGRPPHIDDAAQVRRPRHNPSEVWSKKRRGGKGRKWTSMEIDPCGRSGKRRPAVVPCQGAERTEEGVQVHRCPCHIYRKGRATPLLWHCRSESMHDLGCSFNKRTKQERFFTEHDSTIPSSLWKVSGRGTSWGWSGEIGEIL